MEKSFCFNTETKPLPFTKSSCHHCCSTVGRALEIIHQGFVKVPDENRCFKTYFLCIVKELISFCNLSLSCLSQRIRCTGTNIPLSQCLPSCKQNRIKTITVCFGQIKTHSSSLVSVLGEDSVSISSEKLCSEMLIYVRI